MAISGPSNINPYGSNSSSVSQTQAEEEAASGNNPSAQLSALQNATPANNSVQGASASAQSLVVNPATQYYTNSNGQQVGFNPLPIDANASFSTDPSDLSAYGTTPSALAASGPSAYGTAWGEENPFSFEAEPAPMQSEFAQLNPNGELVAVPTSALEPTSATGAASALSGSSLTGTSSAQMAMEMEEMEMVQSEISANIQNNAPSTSSSSMSSATSAGPSINSVYDPGNLNPSGSGSSSSGAGS